MNYQKIHDKIIHRSVGRELFCYAERHHIIPKCMGGGNEVSNIAILTPEEHFLVHQLLVKIYPQNKKLIHAAHLMGNSRINNKSYGWLRRKHAKACSGPNCHFFGKSGENSINFGRKTPKETCEKISKSLLGIKRSAETKLKMSMSHKGDKNYAFGTKQSEESNQKRSKALLGRAKSKEAIEKSANNRKKPIQQLSKNGEFIRDWSGVIDAAKDLKINSQNITSCLRGRRNFCGGFMWRFATLDSN